MAEAVDGRSGSKSAWIKWPNDVLIDGGKVAGILVEGRPQEGWAVLGIGLNVAVRVEDLPPELRDSAASLGLEPASIEPMLDAVIAALTRWLEAGDGEILAAVRARDALLDQPVRWRGMEGVGAGIDGDGRLIVALPDGGRTTLEAGEVHLGGGGGQASEE